MELLAAAASTLQSAERTLTDVARKVSGSVPSLSEAAQHAVERARSSALTKTGVVLARTASEVLGTIVNLFA